MPHPTTPPIVAPSILSADFTRFAEQVRLADPTREWVHCDIMDDHFVPNLTFGPMVVAATRRVTPAFLDVHLMIQHPERLMPAFRQAGADQLTVHLEAEHDASLGEVLATIRGTGARVGLAIKPHTPFSAAEPYLDVIDLLLVMTVEPGFGGQSFMAHMMPKVRDAAAWRQRNGGRFLIEVDGGIAVDTARVARASGAEVFVAGNAIYAQPEPLKALHALREAVR